MAKVAPISEQFQHWLEDLKEGFWGDLYGQTRLAWKKFFEADSARQRDLYCGAGWHARREDAEPDYRNGYYERDFVTRFGHCGCGSRGPGERTSCRVDWTNSSDVLKR